VLKWRDEQSTEGGGTEATDASRGSGQFGAELYAAVCGGASSAKPGVYHEVRSIATCGTSEGSAMPAGPLMAI
jgi:hypothetical protein